jgi:hypothetical protein
MADELTIEVSYKRAVGKLESISPEVRAALLDTALALELALVERIKGKTPVRTGKMRARVRGRVRSSPKSVLATVGSYAPHARLIEGGATLPAHDILPNAKMTMHFLMGSAEVFAKRVHFPGGKVPAQHPVHSAFGEMKEEIANGIKDAVRFGVSKGNG